MSFIVAVHVPIAALSLIPVLLKWPLILLPAHVVFLELIIDPACSIAFEAEPEEKDVMRRPPRRRKEPLFGRNTVTISLLQGMVVTLITLAIYGYNLHQGRGELEARTLTFAALVIANLGLILANRFWSTNLLASLRSRNAALWLIVAFTLVFLGIVIYIPGLRDLFRFTRLHLNDWVVVLLVGVVAIFCFEVIKYFTRRSQSEIRVQP